jgi:tetratricopeptide (TPR) repeat protein
MNVRRLDSKFLVAIFGCVIVAVGGCKRREVVVVPPPVVQPVIVRVDAPVAVYSPVPTSLPAVVSPPVPGAWEREQADHAFTAGSYDEAIQGYEKFLMVSPGGDGRGEALFRLALSYALRSNRDSDWQRARTTLKQLIDEYPNSSLKPPALVILTLRSQADELSGNIKAREQAIKQLSAELERLKQIDADRGRIFAP